MEKFSIDNTQCSGREELVHLYLDGELSRVDREAFEVHLQTCRTCQSLRVEMQALFTALASLDNVAPPVSITAGVMANLPARRSLRQHTLIGYLALAGQIAVGLLLILTARPMIGSVTGGEWIEQSRRILVEMVISSMSWFVDSAVDLSQRLQTQWPPTLELSGLNISLGMTLAIVAGLGLAWLVGNTMLLYRQPPSLKNGGTR